MQTHAFGHQSGRRGPQGCHSVDSLLTWPTGSTSWDWSTPLLCCYILFTISPEYHHIVPTEGRVGPQQHHLPTDRPLPLMFQSLLSPRLCPLPYCSAAQPWPPQPWSLVSEQCLPRLSTLVPPKKSIPPLTVLVSPVLVLVPWHVSFLGWTSRLSSTLMQPKQQEQFQTPWDCYAHFAIFPPSAPWQRHGVWVYSRCSNSVKERDLDKLFNPCFSCAHSPGFYILKTKLKIQWPGLLTQKNCIEQQWGSRCSELRKVKNSVPQITDRVSQASKVTGLLLTNSHPLRHISF